VDAMEKDGGTITVTTACRADHLVVEVEDSGPGIPPANLDRIFDPFYTTKPVGKGTGLGLSICYGIIKKMGGDIHVRSVMDHGTTFTIEVPIRKENPAKKNPGGEHRTGNELPLYAKGEQS